MLRRPPVPTRTDTLFPFTTLFRSLRSLRIIALAGRNLTRRDDLAYGVVEPHLGAQAGEAPGLVEYAHGKAAAGGLLVQIVMEEEMAAGRGVSACHREIERAVAVIVDPLDAVVRDIERGAGGQDVFEALAAEVAVEAVRGLLRARLAGVGGDEEIEPAVIVAIAPSGADRMIILRETDLRRDILGVAVALVAVEACDVGARDEQVHFAVIGKRATRCADSALSRNATGR